MIAEYLKRETKSYHDQLEELMLTKKIFDQSLSFAEYLKIMQVNLLVHQQIEPQLENMLSDTTKNTLDFSQRVKLPYLRQDVSNPLPVEGETNDLASEEQALGAFYVLEGATLGGSIIKKQLSKNPFFANATFNYYGMYGDGLGSKWKTFQDILEKEVSAERKDEALAGAVKTYKTFIAAAEKYI